MNNFFNAFDIETKIILVDKTNLNSFAKKKIDTKQYILLLWQLLKE